jgi:hypothetical protein
VNTAIFCICGHTVKNLRQMPAHEKGLGHRTRMSTIEHHAAGFVSIQARYRKWFDHAGLPVEEGHIMFHTALHENGVRRGFDRILWVPQVLAQIVTCGRDYQMRLIFLSRFALIREADRPAFLQALDAAIRISSPEDALDLIFDRLPVNYTKG